MDPTAWIGMELGSGSLGVAARAPMMEAWRAPGDVFQSLLHRQAAVLSEEDEVKDSETVEDSASQAALGWVEEEGSWQGTFTAGFRDFGTFAFVVGHLQGDKAMAKRTLWRAQRMGSVGGYLRRACNTCNQVPLHRYVQQHSGNNNAQSLSTISMSAMALPVCATPHVAGVFAIVAPRNALSLPAHIIRALEEYSSSFAELPKLTDAEHTAMSKHSSSEATKHVVYAAVCADPGKALRSPDMASILSVDASVVGQCALQLLHTVVALESRFPGFSHQYWEQAFSWYQPSSKACGRAYLWPTPGGGCSVATVPHHAAPSMQLWVHSCDLLTLLPQQDESVDVRVQRGGGGLVAASSVLRVLLLAVLRAGWDRADAAACASPDSRHTRETGIRRLLNTDLRFVQAAIRGDGVYAKRFVLAPKVRAQALRISNLIELWDAQLQPVMHGGLGAFGAGGLLALPSVALPELDPVRGNEMIRVAMSGDALFTSCWNIQQCMDRGQAMHHLLASKATMVLDAGLGRFTGSELEMSPSALHAHRDKMLAHRDSWRTVLPRQRHTHTVHGIPTVQQSSLEHAPSLIHTVS